MFSLYQPLLERKRKDNRILSIHSKTFDLQILTLSKYNCQKNKLHYPNCIAPNKTFIHDFMGCMTYSIACAKIPPIGLTSTNGRIYQTYAVHCKGSDIKNVGMYMALMQQFEAQRISVVNVGSDPVSRGSRIRYEVTLAQHQRVYVRKHCQTTSQSNLFQTEGPIKYPLLLMLYLTALLLKIF